MIRAVRLALLAASVLLLPPPAWAADRVVALRAAPRIAPSIAAMPQIAIP